MATKKISQEQYEHDKNRLIKFTEKKLKEYPYLRQIVYHIMLEKYIWGKKYREARSAISNVFKEETEKRKLEAKIAKKIVDVNEEIDTKKVAQDVIDKKKAVKKIGEILKKKAKKNIVEALEKNVENQKREEKVKKRVKKAAKILKPLMLKKEKQQKLDVLAQLKKKNNKAIVAKTQKPENGKEKIVLLLTKKVINAVKNPVTEPVKNADGSITYKPRNYVQFSLISDEGERRYYTIPLRWLFSSSKIDVKEIYNKMKLFHDDPVNFKQNLGIVDAKHYVDNIERDILGSDDFFNFEVEEPLDIDIADIMKDESDLLDELMEFDGDEIEHDVFGKAKKQGVNAFHQKNEQKKGELCFFAALKYYNIKNVGVASQIKKFPQIIEFLDSLNASYTIYEDNIDVKQVQNIKPGTVINNNGQTMSALPQTEVKKTLKILAEKIVGSNKRLVFAIRQHELWDHIFVPEMKVFALSMQKNKLYASKKDGAGFALVADLKQKLDKINFIFYDLETVRDEKREMKFKPVSMSVTTLLCKKGEVCKMGIDVVKKELLKNTRFYLDGQLNVWKEIHSFFLGDAKNVIIGFNSSCFDNIFLLDSMRENNVHPQILVNNGMLELKNGYLSNHQYITKDLRRYLGGSLQACCSAYLQDHKEFQKKAQKELFPELQKWNDIGIETVQYNEEFLQFRQRLEHYNNLDVTSLGLLTKTTIDLFTSFKTGFDFESAFLSCISMPQMIFKYWKKMKEAKIESIGKIPKMIAQRKDLEVMKKIIEGDQDSLPAFNLYLKQKYKLDNIQEMEKFYKEQKQVFTNIDEYHVLQTLATGGRSQCTQTQVGYNSDHQNAVNNDISIKSLDVCSLYPFTYLFYNKAIFAQGSMKRVTTYTKGDIGVFFGYVTQNLLKDELPFYCEKTQNGNNWGDVDRKRIHVIFTSHEIEHILSKKPHWSYEIVGGYVEDKAANEACYELNKKKPKYYREQGGVRGLDLFQCMIPFVKEKCRQDKLKQNNLPFNSAVRELCKLVMNSLSGKFLQKHKQAEMVMDKRFNIRSEVQSEDEFRVASLQKDKYNHIGLFIYSLSKIYMYENMLQHIPSSQFSCMDTDSCKINTNTLFSIWYEKVGKKPIQEQIWPECLELNVGYEQDNLQIFHDSASDKQKVFGQFEDEYFGKFFTKALYCDKKEYFCTNGKSSKVCMKGINKNNFLLIDETNPHLRVEQRYKGKLITPEQFQQLSEDEQLRVSTRIVVSDDVYQSNEHYDYLDMCISSKTPADREHMLEQIMMRKMQKKKSFVIQPLFKREIKNFNVARRYIIKMI